MADDSKILSPDEMTTILNASKKNTLDLTQLMQSVGTSDDRTKSFSSKLLSNITDLTAAECRKNFANFIRRKVLVSTKKAEIIALKEALQDKLEKKIYYIAKLLPHNFYTLIVLDAQMLHQFINIVFGGQINETETSQDVPGKISMFFAEKVCQLALESFVTSCKEYGAISFEMIKIITVPNLITKFEENDRLYCLDLDVTLGSFESVITVMVQENFLFEFIPNPEPIPVPVDTKNSWRSVIESQVVDSFVNLTVSLPDIKIKLKDFLEMKKEAVLDISDPTAVYIGLNNLKIFRAKAGQLNNKRVVEIVREI